MNTIDKTFVVIALVSSVLLALASFDFVREIEERLFVRRQRKKYERWLASRKETDRG